VGEDDRLVRLEAAALLFESAADELELAGAHAWAAIGHLKTGEERLLVQAQEHRQRSLL